MAKDITTDLQSRVAWYLSRGYKDLQVINAIKQKGNSKFITITAIKNRISEYRTSEKLASKLGQLGMQKTLANLGSRASIGNQRNATVSFHFQFDFGTSQRTTKQGRQAVYLSVDVPLGMTKRQLLDYMQQAARDWIEEKYVEDSESRGRIRITTDLIRTW
jgi:hypothetical protein